MVFTSDQAFFDKIGETETKRYFDECYKFICKAKVVDEAVKYQKERDKIISDNKDLHNTVKEIKHKEMEKEWVLER